MTDKPIKILLIEDNPGDVRLVQEMLKEVKDFLFEMEAFDKLSDGFSRLEKGGIDIIFLDLLLPDSQGLETFNKVYTRAPQVPIVVFTGIDDAKIALQILKAGGEDYLIKGQFDASLLSRAIRYAVERKRAEEEVRRAQERFSGIYNSSKDAIGYANMQGFLLDVNDSFCRLVGYSREELLSGKRYQDLTPEEYREYESRIIEEIFRTGESKEYEKEYIRKDGSRVPILLTTFVIKGLDGKPIGIAAIIKDITERKQAEEKLKALNKELLRSNKKLAQLALKDSDTGLYNHRYLTEVIEAEFYRAKRYGHPFSVIMLDIDYFKSINDVFGHQFGDLVLRQLAKLLKRMVRRYDIVIRFGGEEFVVISSGIDMSQAYILAQRLLDAVSLYNFGEKKQIVKLKLSIAVVSYPEDREIKGIDLIELAEQILNKAKEHGGNRVYSSLDVKKLRRPALVKGEDITNIKFLRERIEKLTKRSNQSLIEAVFAFARTIKLKDRYTGEHVERIVYFATEIARELGLSKDEVELVRQAAILHDLGKVGISDKILLKPSKLTKKEFDEIKKHPQIGVDIIRPIQFLHSIIPLILYHHERWDGKGYPKGLKAEEIPVGARIVAIADVFQALISDRPYRKAYFKEEAIKIIKEGSGTQFDPRIVNIFLKVSQQEKKL